MGALLIFIIVLVFIVITIHFATTRKPIAPPDPKTIQELLTAQVDFYNELSFEKKKEFEERVIKFLSVTKITGVRTVAEDLDKVLVAASAIIPIFGFPGWEYPNINEVLLYPEHFDHDFRQTGEDRSISGMVGSGAYNNVMILSKKDLREAFINKTSTSNTAIHEFVHLIDKSDGAVDGIPEVFLQRKYIMPWLKLMKDEVEKIYNNNSDIDAYAITDEGEFLAVVAEYFFERPDLLEENHPQLYKQLCMIFRKK